VSVLRTRYPRATVADIYQHPRLGDLAALLDAAAPSTVTEIRAVRPTPIRAQAIQILVTAVVNTLAGLRWLTVLAALNNLLSWMGAYSWAPTLSWWWVLGGFVLFMSPLGRMAITVAGARLLLRGVQPGTYPRGGGVHLRLWSAERWPGGRRREPRRHHVASTAARASARRSVAA
jgi:hypothetical protein